MHLTAYDKADLKINSGGSVKLVLSSNKLIDNNHIAIKRYCLTRCAKGIILVYSDEVISFVSVRKEALKAWYLCIKPRPS